MMGLKKGTWGEFSKSTQILFMFDSMGIPHVCGFTALTRTMFAQTYPEMRINTFPFQAKD